MENFVENIINNISKKIHVLLKGISTFSKKEDKNNSLQKRKRNLEFWRGDVFYIKKREEQKQSYVENGQEFCYFYLEEFFLEIMRR